MKKKYIRKPRNILSLRILQEKFTRTKSS